MTRDRMKGQSPVSWCETFLCYIQYLYQRSHRFLVFWMFSWIHVYILHKFQLTMVRHLHINCITSTTHLLESNALPVLKGIFHVTWLILCHIWNTMLISIKLCNHWANRWWSRRDTTDAAVESVHSGEFPLHYNVDSFWASEIVTYITKFLRV
jgi:hypothetical protein